MNLPLIKASVAMLMTFSSQNGFSRRVPNWPGNELAGSFVQKFGLWKVCKEAAARQLKSSQVVKNQLAR